ncbi:MAG: hypothetical protein IAF38_17475 [Bacteroidia bacterium]|nr:hypothetical protein [Bacteroidia bacterium]
MNSFWDLLKITLPALAVFLCAFFLVKKFLDNEQKKRDAELKKSASQILTPIRLQAYERIIIFLERIHPTSLAMRVNKTGMSSDQLHGELIKTIKGEYEHNISQQIYISSTAWELVKTSKEETIKIINLSSTKVQGASKSTDLAQVIIQLSSSVDRLPSQIALEYVKKEAASMF